MYFTSPGESDETFEAHLCSRTGKGWLTNAQFRALFECPEAREFVETRERVLMACETRFSQGYKIRKAPTAEGKQEIASAEHAFKEKVAETLGVDVATLDRQIAKHHPIKTRNSYNDLVREAQSKWGTRGAAVELGL